MQINVNSLKKFKDELSLLIEMNSCENEATFIYLFEDKKVEVKNFFSIADVEDCANFIIIGRKRWKNLGYTNIKGILIGMCSNYLSWEREIWLNQEWRLIDITFSSNGGYSWDIMKPTLVIKNRQNEKREFTPEKSIPWDEAFPELFKLAFETQD